MSAKVSTWRVFEFRAFFIHYRVDEVMVPSVVPAKDERKEGVRHFRIGGWRFCHRTLGSIGHWVTELNTTVFDRAPRGSLGRCRRTATELSEVPGIGLQNSTQQCLTELLGVVWVGVAELPQKSGNYRVLLLNCHRAHISRL